MIDADLLFQARDYEPSVYFLFTAITVPISLSLLIRRVA